MNATYTCSTCKRQFTGEPATRNACGSFCGECWNRAAAKSVERQKAENTQTNGVCLYCGAVFVPYQTRHATQHVCRYCEKMRERMLLCIRNGPKLAEYVASTEKREAELRVVRERERKLLLAVKQSEMKAEPNQSQEPSELEASVKRLERNFKLLIEKLGGF